MNGPTSAATHPAGFWIRLVAFLVDLLVIMIAQFLLQVLSAARFGSSADGAMSRVGFFTLVFAVAYPTVLHAVAGQTLGKLAMRVRVVALDGSALPLGAAFLRAVAFWAALLVTFGIGHVVGGLRKDKRTFHDLLAGSRAERLPRVVTARHAIAARPAPPAGLAEEDFPSPPPESEPRSIR